LARQVVGDLQIDEIRIYQVRPRPTLIYCVGQVRADIETPLVSPAVIKPFLQLVAGIVVENVDIQLTLLDQARQSEVAASKKADCRVVHVLAVKQIELRVQRMAK